MRIGMFDSGVGGLTVLKEFIRRMPGEEYIYFGDTKRVPYGDKSSETIIKYAQEIIEFLLTKNVDIIIIACNSVSAVALDEIKNNYKIPIYGVITPTVEYIKNKKYNKIGIIGTKATINSNIYERLIDDNQLFIRNKACPLLVPAIEENVSEKLIETIIEYYLEELKEDDIETIVLGCTHYPIIEQKIKEYLNIDIINPAILLAEQIKNQRKSIGEKLPKYEFYFSEINDNVKVLASKILGIKINNFNKKEF